MSKTIDVNPEPPDNNPFRRKGGQPPQVELKLPPVRTLIMFVLAICVFGVLFMAATGRLGVVNVTDRQVAVKVNYITGSRQVIDTPGYQVYIPLVMEVFPFDRSSQKFVMEGDRVVKQDRSTSQVPRLTVRASDGSNFWFETLEIQYEIMPENVAKLLDDSGEGDQFKAEWVKGYARSVLRDAFGRYTAVEAANPSTYQVASTEAKDRLNAFLSPHGIRVVRIITPKPKFDAEYESAIEQRKEADQEVERLIAKEKQLTQERRQRLAAVLKEKEIEMQSLEGDLVRELRQSEKSAIRIKLSADEYAIGKVAEGQAMKAEMIARARGLTAKYEKEAEGLTKKAQALEERGSVVVREAWIEKLMHIRFQMVPYSRDANPRRLEHSDGRQATLIDDSLIGEGR